MNDVLESYERRSEREREQAKRDALALRREREDAQAVMALPEARRLLARFLRASGVDATGYRSDPHDMGHAVGWQDAGRWWLEVIREYCPEREQQMRAEAKREAREGANDEADDAS